MAPAKKMHVWINAMRQWVNQIDDSRTNEQPGHAAADKEPQAEHKPAAKRQFV